MGRVRDLAQQENGAKKADLALEGSIITRLTNKLRFQEVASNVTSSVSFCLVLTGEGIQRNTSPT